MHTNKRLLQSTQLPDRQIDPKNRRGKPTEKGGQTDKGDPANEVV